jgi:hypothetical protein
MSHPFEVGKIYRNRVGEYVVLAIAGDRMTIRYEPGGTLTTNVHIQARIWENIQLERQVAQAEERQRQAQEARAVSRKRSAQARRAARKPAFDGLQKGDFGPKPRGIAWSDRQELGKALAKELNRSPGSGFISQIVPRRPKLHIARSEDYDRKALERNAAFFVIVEEEGVSYGFRVGKPAGKGKTKGPWSSFLAALEEDVEARQRMQSAMEAHGLSLDVYATQTGYGRVGRITVQGRGFLWEHETAEQAMSQKMSWEQLVEYLQGVAPGKRCNLYLQKQISPDTALKAGAGIVGEIAAVFGKLVPLYDASVGR